MKTAYDIIIRPIVTEQSIDDIDVKKYFFEVDKRANKIQIANAVEEIFDVRVIKVTTSNVKGKKKRLGNNPSGYTKSWKKACVKLSADSKDIDVFDNMG